MDRCLSYWRAGPGFDYVRCDLPLYHDGEHEANARIGWQSPSGVSIKPATTRGD